MKMDPSQVANVIAGAGQVELGIAQAAVQRNGQIPGRQESVRGREPAVQYQRLAVDRPGQPDGHFHGVGGDGVQPPGAQYTDFGCVQIEEGKWPTNLIPDEATQGLGDVLRYLTAGNLSAAQGTIYIAITPDHDSGVAAGDNRDIFSALGSPDGIRIYENGTSGAIYGYLVTGSGNEGIVTKAGPARGVPTVVTCQVWLYSSPSGIIG